MPVSLDELVADLEGCFRAGATGVRLHVRDASGNETLDPSAVNETCRRGRLAAQRAGVSVEVGVTTRAWTVPDLAERIAMIREWEGVDCATVNLSEDGFEGCCRLRRRGSRPGEHGCAAREQGER